MGNALGKDFDVPKPGPGNLGNFIGHVAFPALAEMEDAHSAMFQSFTSLSNDRLVDVEASFLTLVNERQRAIPEVRFRPTREPQANPVRQVETRAVVERRRRDHRVQMVDTLRPAIGGVLKYG